MKKIAYIEIDTHAEIAQGFMDVMYGSEEFAVDYYFSKRIKDQVKENGESVYLSDSSMILDQLKTQKYDLIIIGTVHRYFNTFLAIVRQYNAAVIAHNLNFIQASKLKLIRNIFKGDIIYRLKLWWKESLVSAPEVYKKAKNLLVLDEGLVAQNYKFLPLFYTKNNDRPDNKVLTIVIPGGVSQKRRDYAKIFSIINDRENNFKNGSVRGNQLLEFVFLGKASGKELKEIIGLERALENINIKYFSERVSADDFESHMQKADVLWCPVQQEAEFFSQKEIYGVTKMTGNIGDAIKYGKLAVFPGNYPSRLSFIIPEQEGNVIQQLEELKNQQFDFHENYNRERVQKRLEEVLKNIISI
ncbi:hypothetical protein [Chryseobacterium sp. Alg-005]|uniref:hypothetical protein n=1 Tax=Chryseobacterium sp. Alg-005 TaxID=3159516 RepID=UPI0036F40D5A